MWFNVKNLQMISDNKNVMIMIKLLNVIECTKFLHV